MELKRAQEIINSANNIDVFYEGNPVWIEGIDSNKGNADITMLETRTKVNVPLLDLREK